MHGVEKKEGKRGKVREKSRNTDSLIFVVKKTGLEVNVSQGYFWIAGEKNLV